MRETIDCLFVFSYGVGETRAVMDERPPSQVAARRLLLVLPRPSWSACRGHARTHARSTHARTPTRYTIFLMRLGGGVQGARGGRCKVLNCSHDRDVGL